jgi:CRISPR-associated protein Cas5
MENNKLDLSFFLEPPELTKEFQITLTALAPLSMVSSQPGSYFRTELAPTSNMLYGMLENALGWHFSDDAKKDNIRTNISKGLAKQARKVNKKNVDFKEHPWLTGNHKSSQSGFKSILQYHVKFELVEMPKIRMTYDDLWSMANRTESDSFIGGSRNYDFKLENLINLSKREDVSKPVNKKTGKHPRFISFGDRKEYQSYTLKELMELKEGLSKTTSLKPFFPMYYSSPRKRGYVIPESPYVFKATCTPKVAKLLEVAINEPCAPLYLGSNDGWVHVNWENL